jgi:TRAP-type C4-dicarboxylate transport system permease small subunit
MLQSREFGFRWRESVEKRHTKRHTLKSWYPSGLQWWNLIIAIVLCCTFAALLRCYLWKRQTQGGVIFARKINDLPLHISFWYLYLSTIIAVLFSIFIVWIDHDAKRYEPYRHMSQSCGALAKDSILLYYSFDFALFVPIMAAKRK